MKENGIDKSQLNLHTHKHELKEETSIELTEEEAQLLFETLQNKRKQVINEDIDRML
ncbi:hypothetical protein [Metabacillus iocasae]|uniref:Uncharacterized protein n=1 Tax=Priestia iocasae TaxID=2291674 RepID=A0ABS2QXU2_9BACI|nr:hypothetical protein [Metabacillus iocasae]MBM7703294.1 hypothetical protein [Metabacillus iocasae]